jgi:hypothetical protein
MDHEPDPVKRIAELERRVAEIEENKAITVEAIAAVLEKMAQSARPRTLSEAANVIREMWGAPAA